MALFLPSAPSIRLTSGFHPTDIANAELWSEADEDVFTTYNGSTPCVNDDGVGFWNDQVGGTNWTQGTGAFTGGDDAIKPTFKTNVLGDKPGILFPSTASTYLNLGRALFNSATEYTFVCFISFSGLTNAARSLCGVNATNRQFQIQVDSTGSGFGVVNTRHDTTVIRADAIGHTGGWNSLPNPTAMLGIVRAKIGTGVELRANGIVANTATWTANAMTTQQLFFLGLYNTASSTTGITPTTNVNVRAACVTHAIGAYNRYLTDAEIGSLERYLMRKWGGNLCYKKSPDIKPSSGHIQGVCDDEDGNYYVTYTSEIRKYDSAWNLLATNASPFSGIPGTLGHCGGCDFWSDELYVAIAGTGSGTGVDSAIGVFDKTTLALKRYKVTSTDVGTIHIPCLAVAPEINAVFIPQYYQAGTIMHRFRLSDLGYVGQVTLSTASSGNQGITWKPPYLYFASNDGTLAPIRRCLPDGSGMEAVTSFFSTQQGIHCSRKSGDFLTVQETVPAEYVWRMRPLR